MLSNDIISFQEFMNREILPLSTIQKAVLEFLRHRDDVAVFGAYAVNAYVEEPRMTQDIDLMSVSAPALAEELCTYLSEKFYIAVRVREVKQSQEYRIYQLQSAGDRHLVNIRKVANLPECQRIEEILVIAPPDLIASKVISYYQRRGKPKSGTDWRDLAMLLLTFPELKQESSRVLNCLLSLEINEKILELWRELVQMEIDSEDDEF
jgi:hypothetical protein